MKNVVLDLDGTMLFTSPAEISIQNRTRPSYLAEANAELLAEIGLRSNLYIASARHAISVRKIARAILNVRFAGFVCECGLVARTCIDQPGQESPSRQELAMHLQRALKEWVFIEGYEHMICCLAPDDVQSPLTVAQELLGQFEAAAQWCSHQERHKTFFYPQPLSKVAGLQRLGVSAIDFAAGDDDLYDGDMLKRASFPLTHVGANPKLVRMVSENAGFVSDETSHEAAEQILREIIGRL